MKLFYTPSSPYAAAVLATIYELNAESKVEFCVSAPFDNNPEFIAANPLAKVPCLIDDGLTVMDSEVICDYIDANISGGILFEDIYANWHLKTFYSICSGLIDTLVNLRIEVTRQEQGIKSDFWWRRYNDAITRTLTEVENRLESLPEKFTIIHITLYCALGYLDFRHSEINWREPHTQLADFYRLHAKRESLSKLKFI